MVGMTNEEMLTCTAKDIIRLDEEISKLNKLRDMWMKIAGKLEGEIYGRIFP